MRREKKPRKQRKAPMQTEKEPREEQLLQEAMRDPEKDQLEPEKARGSL